VFGHVDRLSRWGSRFAPVSNWIVRGAPMRWMNERMVGIDARRTPPAWARESFASVFSKWREGTRSHRKGHADALLFNDTFTNYYHPDVGAAAVEVLAASGVNVTLAPNVCCGRPLISQGLLAEARQRVAVNTERLFPFADNGQPIVFLEPSCLSAVRDDGPALLRGELQRKAQRVSERSVLFEELLEERYVSGATQAVMRNGPATILLHGHCHQKAMGLLAPAKALLSRIPGSTIVDLDAGCCGMAGSWGYARDHYDVSRTIAERKLLPAVRNREAGSAVVASGTSCRSQVADFTGVVAVHPAELLRSLLRPT
jgi:Fe-S oxidoreductase